MVFNRVLFTKYLIKVLKTCIARCKMLNNTHLILLYSWLLGKNGDGDCFFAEEQTGAGQGLWQAEQFYNLRETAQRHIRKFKTTGTDYLLTLQPQHPLSEQLGEIFDSMVQQDLVQYVLQSRFLTYPISLPVMPQHELTANRIMGEVQRVLQSNEDVNVEDGMHVHLVHVGMPHGGKGSRRKRKNYGFQLDKSLGAKQSVIRIANKDNLCLARTLATDMARQEKHPDWNNKQI